jgi:5-methylcytosine-specific restriction endonuclease McrA
MPVRAPRICSCGLVVPNGRRCACELARDRERKARHDARRPSSSARGYTGRWEREKAKYLARHPACRICSAPATTVDHVTPHKGDECLFWDRKNWQPLCGHCHNSTKQRLERRVIERA